MKKIITAIFLFALGTQIVKSQVPEKFNYQGVLRNASNELITNTNIGLQVSLYEGSSSETAVYVETHETQTNSYGQFSVQVATGTTTDDFSAIDWSSGQVYLKVSVDETGGSDYTDLPKVQLIAVPYALYANDVANKDDADADPNNEIQQLSFKNDSVFISDGNGIKMPYDSSNWVIEGNTMYYNGGNVGIGSSTPLSNLEVKSNTAGSAALFQVINANNDTVFAVYPDGVKIFVDQSAKGKVGGFAISGRSPNKGPDVDILKVTLDSTRIYVSDTISSKGKVGGFAVSGRSPNKGLGNEYLVITPDSTRVYVNDTSETKGKVGGFAVSGRSPNKGVANDYMRITKDSTRIYVTESTGKGKVGGFAISGRSPNKGLIGDYFNVSGNESAEVVNNESRVMWYPKKAALLAGEVHVGSSDSVGTNSTAIGYRNIAMGDYSQAMGYNAKAFGSNSTAFGNNASVDSSNAYAFGNNTYAGGNNSYAIGNAANVTGEGSYAVGSGAQATGDYSFAIGSDGIDSSGVATNATKAIGDYSYAFGLGSSATGQGAFAIGASNIAAGNYSLAMGYKTNAESYYSTTLGAYTTASNYGALATGYHTTASGQQSTSLGIYTEASGPYAIAMGWGSTATKSASFAMGYFCTASGMRSVALGSETEASNIGATALGVATLASGAYSLASGSSTLAGEFTSTAMGFFTKATGQASTALGRYSEATNQGSLASGGYTKANGSHSTAMGYKIQVDGVYSFGIGLMNFSTVPVVTQDNTMAIMGGDVGIGTVSPSDKLEVAGNIRVAGGSFIDDGAVLSDFVFEPDYKLESIEEHAKFMWENKHLPALASEKEIKEAGGYDIVERREQILEELEKAHIYIDQLNNEIKNIKSENETLKKKIDEIMSLITK
ncbi:MAG: hypothetical protein KQH79_08455 [Bacteroidetes bacterium]|nr:hypothetical protein [Bacteroidota bacterium]